jgi:GDPmannose 4,6-dehydratase
VLRCVSSVKLRITKKSKTQLGLEPEYDLAGLVKDMMDSDIKLVQKDIHLLEKRHEVFRQAE